MEEVEQSPVRSTGGEDPVESQHSEEVPRFTPHGNRPHSAIESLKLQDVARNVNFGASDGKPEGCYVLDMGRVGQSGRATNNVECPPYTANIPLSTEIKGESNPKRGARSEAECSAISMEYPEVTDAHSLHTGPRNKFSARIEELKMLYKWYGGELDYLTSNKYPGRPREGTKADDMSIWRKSSGGSLVDVPLDTVDGGERMKKHGAKQPHSDQRRPSTGEKKCSGCLVNGDHSLIPRSEFEVLEEGDKSGADDAKVTSMHAFFVAVKAFVGTGVLFLPKAFFNGGILFSSILIIIVAYSTLYCMILLADVSAHYRGMSYGEIAGKLYGQKMRSVVLGSICLSQAGFCCAYYIFVGQNIRDFALIVSDCKFRIPYGLYIMGQLLFTIPLCLVRNLGKLSTSSIIGDFIIIVSITYIVGYCIWLITTGRSSSADISLFNTSKFTHFVGAAMFSFEGIALVTPLTESMKEPKKIGGMLTICIILVTIIFVTVGVVGLLAFRDKLETNVILNLPENVVSTGVRLIYSIAIILTVPVMIHPCTAIIEAALFKGASGRRSLVIKHTKNLFRAAEVTFLAILSYVGSHHLENVVNLIGCFACIPIAFIYPALLHSRVSSSRIVIMKDYSIAVAGALALVYTTYTTISSFIKGEADVPRDICAGR